MKTILTFIAISCTSILCQATTYTCSNQPFAGAQFTDLGEAYNACAVAGDTILLEKSSNAYFNTASSSWNKSITVIGIGGNADIVTNDKSFIDQIATSPTIAPEGGGSKFYGIEFNTSLTFIAGTNNITIENCLFPDGFLKFNGINENILVINSVFGRNFSTNILFSEPGSIAPVSASFLNCVFFGPIAGYSNPNKSLIIDHCLFLGTINSSHLNGIKNALITNNIFLNALSLVDADTEGCTFLNNVVSTNGVVPPAGNFGSNNLVGSAPAFIDYTPGNSTYSRLHDYALLNTPGNIGLNGATDGTDIGVHGGLTNFNEFLEPSIVPIVTSTDIQTTGAEAGGTINVTVTARQPSTD